MVFKLFCNLVQIMQKSAVSQIMFRYNGDIISSDCGAFQNGFIAVTLYTLGRSGSSRNKKALQVTMNPLRLEFGKLKVGNRVEDIGIQFNNMRKSWLWRSS